MNITLGNLKRLIREAYDKELADDPALAKKSVYVPDDIKKSLKAYFRAMGLSKRKKKPTRS